MITELFRGQLAVAKRRLLQLHFDAGCGHLGGNFSCIEAMMVVHHLLMKPEDRFVLSKGHSAGALYVTLWSLGLLSDDDLVTFTKDNTLLPGHPSGKGIPGLLFSTGSLGHGASLSAGLALAANHKGGGRDVYCLCSDGEWQEGGCWEALTFSVHHKLKNLTILVDQNGLQGFGRTQEVISCSDLASRISAFGASVVSVDGHDVESILSALKPCGQHGPTVILLNTIKGRGLHFANTVDSHYLPLSREQYEFALQTLAKENV